MKQPCTCPSSPNCVSSQTQNFKQRMEPIPYAGSRGAAQQKLENIVRAMPRATIVLSEPGFFAAEFHSLIFRFVDEAEFTFDETSRLIHFRSGARTGYSDFGVNRARMEKIAAAFQSGIA